MSSPEIESTTPEEIVKCIHHWVIPTAGKYAIGICKKCGVQKEGFKNHDDDSNFGINFGRAVDLEIQAINDERRAEAVRARRRTPEKQMSEATSLEKTVLNKIANGYESHEIKEELGIDQVRYNYVRGKYRKIAGDLIKSIRLGLRQGDISIDGEPDLSFSVSSEETQMIELATSQNFYADAKEKFNKGKNQVKDEYSALLGKVGAKNAYHAIALIEIQAIQSGVLSEGIPSQLQES